MSEHKAASPVPAASPTVGEVLWRALQGTAMIGPQPRNIAVALGIDPDLPIETLRRRLGRPLMCEHCDNITGVTWCPNVEDDDVVPLCSQCRGMFLRSDNTDGPL